MQWHRLGLIYYHYPLDHYMINMCHGAHTREEQEHADEDVNSNNSL